MRDIRCDLQARANLLEQQISDENAQFERAILQLKTKLDSNLQHLRAQLRLANKLLEFTAGTTICAPTSRLESPWPKRRKSP